MHGHKEAQLRDISQPIGIPRQGNSCGASAPSFGASGLQGGDAEDRRALAHMQAVSAGGKTAAKPPAVPPAGPQPYPCAPTPARFFPREPVPETIAIETGPKAIPPGDQ